MCILITNKLHHCSLSFSFSLACVFVYFCKRKKTHCVGFEGALFFVKEQEEYLNTHNVNEL